MCRSETWRILAATAGPAYKLERVVDEPAEIVEDLYLGLRAGGALRKQRRGEPLTAEEQEALGRWQQMSNWRKAVAIGAFSLGTFGLGFTLGGLIFGRWRRARRSALAAPSGVPFAGKISVGTSCFAGSLSNTSTSTSVASTAASGVASST